MSTNVSEYKIFEALNMLGIEYEDNDSEWIKIRCPSPSHNDETASCGINRYTAIAHCFSCGYDRHLVGILQDNLKVNYKKACEILDINTVIPKHATKNLENRSNSQTENVSNVPKMSHNETQVKIDGIDSELSPFNPDKYEYTKVRGYTKEYCDKFNIKHCRDGYYFGYMITPIPHINSFEARKIVDMPCNSHLGKVLYPKGNKINTTIFNEPNLDRNKPLIVCEGCASLPKIYENISTNVTSTFGSNISDEQILLLREFKEIIVLTDWDKASFKSINKLLKYVYSVKVFNVKTDDKLDSFVDDLIYGEIISGNRFLINVLYVGEDGKII